MIIGFRFKPIRTTRVRTSRRQVTVTTVAVRAEVRELDVEGAGLIAHIFKFNRYNLLLPGQAFNAVGKSALHSDLTVRPVANTEC